MRHIQVRVSSELAVWFDEHFPHMTKQAFLERCFQELKRGVETGEVGAPDLRGVVRRAVSE